MISREYRHRPSWSNWWWEHPSHSLVSREAISVVEAFMKIFCKALLAKFSPFNGFTLRSFPVCVIFLSLGWGWTSLNKDQLRERERSVSSFIPSPASQSVHIADICTDSHSSQCFTISIFIAELKHKELSLWLGELIRQLWKFLYKMLIDIICYTHIIC